MSTFLDDGKILIKIRRRFMIFTSDGAFIDEVEFNDEILKSITPTYDSHVITLRQFKENQAATRVSEGPDNIDKLKRRRIKQPILDFLGNEYEFKPPQPPVPLSFNNRMELLNMSYNNRFFLFYNRMDETLCVYEIQETMVVDQMQMFGDAPPPMKKIYQFVLMYNLNIDKSHIFQYFYTININPIDYFRNNLSQIKMDDNGGVKLCYVENLPYIEKDDISGASESFSAEDCLQCRLVGSLFSPVEGEFNMKIQNFT